MRWRWEFISGVRRINSTLERGGVSELGARRVSLRLDRTDGAGGAGSRLGAQETVFRFKSFPRPFNTLSSRIVLFSVVDTSAKEV